jgi:hypothetical protein
LQPAANIIIIMITDLRIVLCCAEEWQERGNTECVRRDVHFEEGGAIVAVDEPSDVSATTGDSALTVIDGTNKLLLPGYPPSWRVACVMRRVRVSCVSCVCVCACACACACRANA